MSRLRRQIKDAIIDADGDALLDAAGNPRSGTFSAQDLADFWNDAQLNLALYAARPKTFSIATSVQGAVMPEDLKRVLWVRHDSDADPRLILELDAYLSEGEEDDPVFEGMYWYLDHDTIRFTQTTSYPATVRYVAYFPEIDDPDDETQSVYVPRWAVHGLIYYCAAECMERKMVDDANLRRWAQKEQDAGRPVDNPYIQVAKYMMNRYRSVMVEHSGPEDGSERTSWPSSFR